MSATCPYCQYMLKLKNVQPGRYAPKCPKCGRQLHITVQLQIVVHGEADEMPVVAASRADEATAAAEDAGMTAAPAVAAEDAGVTGAFVSTSEAKPAAAPIKKPKPAGPRAMPPAEKPETLVGTAAPGQPGASGSFEMDEPGDPNTTGAFAEAAEDANATGAFAVTEADETAEEEEPAGEIPATLGGYQVIKELGRGGMGAVYLGRQLSLDRNVALKVMNPQVARDPTFVARFVREAYAAAQLVHHNVVQIYDIGADRDTNFFSMEFVKGRSLMDLVRRQGKLDPEVAVGYVLQAARGLKFGHDMGMIHRDVKPDNLMVNDQGIVKVADLGLVKRAGTPEADDRPAAEADDSPLAGDVTRAGVAMGTPSYMAPEQARDAAHVDARADIYSLGCTLYVLLTGKTPFEGKTILEVLTKHATAPVVPPEVIVKRVPKTLSAILLKMMAKKPDDRYPDMAAVIEALEQYLGIAHAGPFTPREEHAAVLEECVTQFNDAPRARLRGRLIQGFFAGCALAVLGTALLGAPLLAGGFVGLAVLVPLCYFIVHGVTEKTHLFQKARAFVFGSGWSDWLLWLVGGTIFLTVLYLFGLLWVWLGFCIAAVVLALGCHFLIDRQVAQQRAGAIEEAEKLFRCMRLLGLEEQSLRQFVCKYSGRRWEEFYEALFGYEAKLAAREWVRGEAGRAREKFGAWRDSLIHWMDARQQARQEARQRKHLQTVEAKALQAKGMDAAEAQAKAGQMAEVMVTQAAEIRTEAAKAKPGDDAAARRARLKSLVAAARRPDAVYTVQGQKGGSLARLGGGLGGIVGPKVRFLAGAALVGACLLWMHQNHLIEGQKLWNLVGEMIEKKDVRLGTTPALKLPGVPAQVSDLFSSLNAGVAGLVLLASAFFRSWKLGLLVVPGAALAFAGPVLGVPAAGPVGASLVSLAGGLALALLGFVFLRHRK